MLRLVSYRTGSGQSSWQAGIERDQSLIGLASYTADPHVSLQKGTYSSVRAFLTASKAEQEDALAWANRQLDAGDAVQPLEQVELGPPVPDPDKIICLGLNYPEHVAEAEIAAPVAPTFFAKFRNSLIGPTSAIVLPTVSKFIDYEGELAVIMGQRCKGVTQENALAYVGGYTVCNDVSARDLQMQTPQWTAGKAIDTFAPMGPGIVLADDVSNPQNLLLTTSVNNLEVQHESTANMIFSIAKSIAFLSSFMTLEPGDIIMTGTPSGVGGKRKPPLFLHAGDVVEVAIEGIGSIRNPVVADAHI